MRKISTIALMSASLIAIGGTQSAFAQQAPAAAAEEDADEGEIIVTARRKDESLQEVPLSIQAVSGDELKRLDIRNFQDVTAIVPGLQLTRAPNGIQNTVTLRGVSFNPTAAGPQTAVELYRNDVVTSSAAIFQALYDIGQIEVLRGPQGTLKGRASPSGAISIGTRKPDLGEVGGFVNASLAEGGKHNVEAALNVPVFADKLGIRVAGYTARDRLDVEGFNRFTGATNDDVFDKVQSIRASIRANPFDDVLILDFNYESTKRDTQSFEQVQSRSFVDGSGINGPVTISSRDRLGIQVLPNQLTGTYKFYNWQAQLNIVGQRLTYVGGRLDATTNSIAPEDFGGFLANPFATGNTAVSFDPTILNPFAQLTRSQQKQRFNEVRLQNQERIAGIFDYVIGYMNLKSNTPTLLYTTGSACNGCVPATNTVGTLRAQTYGGVLRTRQDEENSFFGNLTAHIGENTEISGGLRRIKFDVNSGLISAGRNALGQILIDREPESVLLTRTPAAAFAVASSVKKNIYSFSAKHNFGGNLLVYANYGTSFRPGNVIICSRCNAAQGTALAGALRMPDETSNSVEAGFKASFLDRKATFNVSVFQQKFKNFTVISPAIQFLASNPPPAAAPFFGNPQALALPNPVKVTGFEAELGFRPSERFSFGANFTYAKSKATNGRVPCVDLDNDNIQDTVALSTAAQAATFAAQAGTGLIDTCAFSSASPAPHFSGTIQSEYNLPVWNNANGYLRGLLTYNGKTRGEDANLVDQVGSYALLNLYLGVRDSDSNWDLSVYGKNLANTQRVVNRGASRAASNIGGTAYASDYYIISTTAPREFGVNLRVALGSK